VDAHGELYQFLALIRQRNGVPLMDPRGRVTSHLVGLFFRTTRLVSDFGLQLVFVFDGPPPPLKSAEIEKWRRIRGIILGAGATHSRRARLRAFTDIGLFDVGSATRPRVRAPSLPFSEAPGRGQS
jgi:hypothetical protein